MATSTLKLTANHVAKITSLVGGLSSDSIVTRTPARTRKEKKRKIKLEINEPALIVLEPASNEENIDKISIES